MNCAEKLLEPIIFFKLCTKSSHLLVCLYILQVILGHESNMTFITHTLVLESWQNYPVKALFGNYQRFSVSTEISANTENDIWSLYTFFKTKGVYSLGILHYYIFIGTALFFSCCFRSPKLFSLVCRNKRGNLFQEKNALFTCGKSLVYSLKIKL